MGTRYAVLAFFAFVSASAGSAQAFDAKQITLKVGYPPGGTYDLSSRLIARYLPKYLPGKPDVIVENVAGAGSLKLAKLMLGSEPADGTVIASVSTAIAFAPQLDPANVNFDTSKIIWLGALSNEPSFCATSKASGIDTIEKFLSQAFRIGASAKNSQTYQLATIPRNGLGGKFEIVSGFAGVPEIELAMERGEIAGHCAFTVLDLKKRGTMDSFNLIGSFGSAKAAVDEDVPRFSALIKDEVVRQGAEFVEATRDFNYPLMVPPGTPEDTVKILRAAYDGVIKDPQFIREAADMGEFTLAPMTGEMMTFEIKRHLEAGDAVLGAAQALVQ
jgi:tripartite-type tricarboxylate transporter receptor subunit TctC